LTVTEPAATALFVTKPAPALRLRPLLISAEIKKLRRGRSGHAQHQSRRNGQRDHPTTPGKDAQLFWILWHAPGPHVRRTCPRRLAQPSCGDSQFTVKSSAETKQAMAHIRSEAEGVMFKRLQAEKPRPDRKALGSAMLATREVADAGDRVRPYLPIRVVAIRPAFAFGMEVTCQPRNKSPGFRKSSRS
jgi:hypothetical protein